MKLKKIMIAMLVGLAFISCEKDDPEIPNEEELISDVTLTLTPVSGGDEVVFNWHDEDGDGVVDDVEVVHGSLAANTTYNSVISLNGEDHEEGEVVHEEESDGHSHGDDIDNEIQEEAVDHQFFYSSVNGLTVTYNDEDTNGNPLGVKTTFITGNDYVGGNLTITLRHEPSKFSDGVSNGDITNAGGETDVEITFALGLQ